MARAATPWARPRRRILAFDRIGEAWLRLAELGAISLIEAAPVLTELQQLTAALDRLFPRARSFVRPGFDEPAAVAMLEWSERGVRRTGAWGLGLESWALG